jgi:hypothetical protein
MLKLQATHRYSGMAWMKPFDAIYPERSGRTQDRLQEIQGSEFPPGKILYPDALSEEPYSP